MAVLSLFGKEVSGNPVLKILVRALCWYKEQRNYLSGLLV